MEADATSPAYDAFRSTFLGPRDVWALRDGPPLELLTPLLRHLLGRARGASRAEIALALWQITADDAMLGELLALARTSGFGAQLHALVMGDSSGYDLIQAIHCLAQLPHPKARARLEELTRDPRYLVRYNAHFALRLRRSMYGIDDAAPAVAPE